MLGAPSTAVRRAARLLAAMVMVASTGLVSGDLAGAVTSTPSLVVPDPTVERGASTAFTSSFDMVEGSALATLNNLGPELVATFTPTCDVTPPAAGRTCVVSPAGLVTVTNGGDPAIDTVGVTIGGSIAVSNDIPLTSTEGASQGTATRPGVTITLNQDGSPMTSPPVDLTVTANPATDVEVQITTTGPPAGATAKRGGTIAYTANLERVGTPAALAQSTLATATLVADGAVATSPAGPTTVTWIANEAGVKAVTLLVNVPQDIPLGDTDAYHVVVTYDPNGGGGSVNDTEIGATRSFQVVVGDSDAVISVATDAPAPGQEVTRGTSVTYTATLTRTGNLEQVTSVNVSLVADGDPRGTTAGSPTNVAFAIGQATTTTSIPVTVPTTATLGEVTYHFRAVYDPTSIGGPGLDAVNGQPRSFNVVPVRPTFTLTPGDATVSRGDALTLVATLVNPAGGEPLTPGIISVTVPAGMSVGPPTATAGTAVVGPVTVPPAVPGVDVARVVTVTYGTIEPNSVKSLTIPVTVLPSATKKDGADLAVTASFNNGVLTDSSNFEVRPDADLRLSITPLTQDVQKKKPTDVTVTLENVGPDPATGPKVVTIDLTGAGEIRGAPAACAINGAKTQAVCTITEPLASGASVSFPITVRAEGPTSLTLEASLTTPAAEFDPVSANNVDVSATVNVQQSQSDLVVTAPAGPVAIILESPTQDVTFTLSVSDPEGPGNSNHGDPAEGVVVEVVFPAAVQATSVSFAGPTGALTGTCTPLPPGSGGSVTCAIGEIATDQVVTVTATVRGTTLLDVAAGITATATTTNIDPKSDNNTASVLVTVVPQPVDLAVNDVGDALLTTSGAAVTEAAGDFTVAVTNNSSAAYAAGAYTVTIDVPDATSGQVELSTIATSDPTCVAAANVVTCTVNTPLGGNPRNFIIRATIKVPGPITVRSTVTLAGPNQVDPVPGNNSDTWAIRRNLPPLAVEDVGPAIPVGAATGQTTLLYKVLDNDSDGDGDALTVTTSFVPGANDPAVAVVDNQIRVVAPAGTNTGTFPIPYTISDGRGTPIGTASAILRVRVVDPIVERVPGSFNNPPEPDKIPLSFGSAIPDELLKARVTPIDVLHGALGERSDGSVFSPAIDYDLTHVNTNVTGPNVEGTEVTLAPDASGTKSLADYSPAPGYTSDRERAGTNPTDPPADAFTYRTTGNKTSDGSTLFTVDSSVEVEVTNQDPIGVDTHFDVPNLVTQTVTPAADGIDGNQAPAIKVDVPDGSFAFNDTGVDDPSRKLKIICIGQLKPTELDASGRPLATITPIDLCPTDAQGVVSPVTGWKKAGDDLELQPVDENGNVTSQGKVTIRLLDDSQSSLTITADAVVVGQLAFHYVLADVRGGSSFAKATVNVPNTPPQVIEGVRTVLKNTPTIVVDTKLAASDANNDVIKVSGITARTEHGTAVIGDENRIITYTPDRDYLGPDKLLYNVTDGRGGAASAELQLNVIEQPSVLGEAAGTPTGAGGSGSGSPAGSLAATGGDPVPLTAAAGVALILGLLLVQAGRRRRALPLLERARHLRT